MPAEAFAPLPNPLNTPSEAAQARSELTSPNVRFATQPILDRQGRVAATELLFRWNSRDGGVGPGLGVYATSAALCHALLDGALLSTACRAASPGPLFVNLDAAGLMSPLAEAVTPDIGVIELLETVAVTKTLRQRVAQLHARGHRFALDDVQTPDDVRWSLARYADFVKIDLPAADTVRWRALISRAHALGLRVVAEKVETADERTQLSALGADLFQGYGIERPSTHSVPALAACERRVVAELYLMARAGAADLELAAQAAADPATVQRLRCIQRLVAPRAVMPTAAIEALFASLPRPALIGWLALLNIAATRDRRLPVGAQGRASLDDSAQRAWDAHHCGVPLESRPSRIDPRWADPRFSVA